MHLHYSKQVKRRRILRLCITRDALHLIYTIPIVHLRHMEEREHAQAAEVSDSQDIFSQLQFQG